MLIQETVSCSHSTTTITCVFPSNVASGNTLIVEAQSKRGVTGLAPWVVTDTLGIYNSTGGGGWHCQPIGPDVTQSLSGTICAGFPTVSGAETITFTPTGGATLTSSFTGGFVSEWKPNIFSPCKDSCTFISGIPNCCGSGTTVPLPTVTTSGYQNNFSIAYTDATFAASCGSTFWTSSVGTPVQLDASFARIAWVLQPGTIGTNITETLNCGTGDTGNVVWAGVIFSSTYVPASAAKPKAQVY